MNHDLEIFGAVCDALINNITLEATSLTPDYDELATVQDLADMLNARGLATKHGKPFNRHKVLSAGHVDVLGIEKKSGDIKENGSG